MNISSLINLNTYKPDNNNFTCSEAFNAFCDRFNQVASKKNKDLLYDIISFITVALKYIQNNNSGFFSSSNSLTIKITDWGLLMLLRKKLHDRHQEQFYPTFILADAQFLIDICGQSSTGLEYSNAVLKLADTLGIQLDTQLLQQIKDTLNNKHLDMNILFFSMTCADTTMLNLEGCYLCHIKYAPEIFLNINLNNLAGISDSNFESAALCNKKFCGIRLLQVDFNGAKLCGTDFSGANLEYVDFSGADLCGTKLIGLTDLTGVLFTNSKFDEDTNISLDMDAIYKLALEVLGQNYTDERFLNGYFQHDADYGNMLTAIDSIPDTYADKKLNLMLQVIGFINHKHFNLSNVASEFFDILRGNLVYYQNRYIIDFLTEKVIPHIIVKANHNKIVFDQVGSDLIFNIMAQLNPTSLHEFMLNNNGCFNQLICYCRRSGSEHLLQLAKDLYFKYLQIDYVCTINSNALEIYTEEDDYLIFIYCDSMALVVSIDYMRDNLYNSTDNMIWTMVTAYNANKLINPADLVLDNIFSVFKLFQASYENFKNRSKFIRLIECLNLGVYKDLFIKVLSLPKSDDKLIEIKYQSDLAHIFNGYLQPYMACGLTMYNAKQITITDAHINDIIRVYELIDQPKLVWAQTIGVLAAVFMKYSSSRYFGSEDDSPTSLRYYAYALFKRASQLDSSVFNEGDVKFTDLEEKLLGLNRAFTCTSILSSKVLSYYKTICPDIVCQILPPAWS